MAGLAHIGIYGQGSSWFTTLERPLGRIRMVPEAFSVQEVALDGAIAPLAGEPQLPPTAPYFRLGLVKREMTTYAAVELVCSILGLDRSRVGYAGLKDRWAVTAQWITVPGETDLTPLLELSNPKIVDISTVATPLSKGKLNGNHFTITVETLDAPGSIGTYLQSTVHLANQKGVPNYYHAQRFGRRLNSHFLGRLLLEERWDDAAFEAVCAQTAFEVPALTALRGQARRHWGHWCSLYGVLASAGADMDVEQDIVDGLRRGLPARTVLNDVPQTQLWRDAVASLEWNCRLSDALNRGTTMNDGKRPAIVHPNLQVVQTGPTQWTFRMSLPGGTYATSVLTQLFDLPCVVVGDSP